MVRPGFANMLLRLFRFEILDASPEAHRAFLPVLSLERSDRMFLWVDTSVGQAIQMTAEAAVADPFLEILVQTNVGARVVRFTAFNGILTPATFEAFAAFRADFAPRSTASGGTASPAAARSARGAQCSSCGLPCGR